MSGRVAQRGHFGEAPTAVAAPIGALHRASASATIVCGSTLGSYCIAGAGTVPTRDVPAFTLMVANPERGIGWVCHGAARPAVGVDGTPVRPRASRRHLETARDRLEEIA